MAGVRKSRNPPFLIRYCLAWSGTELLGSEEYIKYLRTAIILSDDRESQDGNGGSIEGNSMVMPSLRADCQTMS